MKMSRTRACDLRATTYWNTGYIHTYICTYCQCTLHTKSPTNLFHAQSDACNKGSIINKCDSNNQCMGQYMIWSKQDDKEGIKGRLEETMKTGPHLEKGRGQGAKRATQHTQAHHLMVCQSNFRSGKSAQSLVIGRRLFNVVLLWDAVTQLIGVSRQRGAGWGWCEVLASGSLVSNSCLYRMYNGTYVCTYVLHDCKQFVKIFDKFCVPHEDWNGRNMTMMEEVTHCCAQLSNENPFTIKSSCPMTFMPPHPMYVCIWCWAKGQNPAHLTAKAH